MVRRAATAFQPQNGRAMNLMKIVNYKNARAFYIVEYRKDKTFVATLHQYQGEAAHTPPRSIAYLKNNRSAADSLQEKKPSLLEDVANSFPRK